MENTRRPILRLEKGEKLKVLFYGNDFPFVAEALKQKLEKKSCQVFEQVKKGLTFDYILIFGPQKNIGKILRLLKERGKALLIASEEKDALVLEKDLPLFLLSTGRSLTVDVLVRQILKKLFSAKAGRPQGAEKTAALGAGKARRGLKVVRKNLQGVLKKPSPAKISSKKALLFLFISLAISPFLIFAGSLFLSAKNLQKLKSLKITLKEREKILKREKIEVEIAKKSFLFLKPLFSIVSPRGSDIAEQSISILENLTSAGEEAVYLEKIFKAEGKNLLGGDNIFLKERLLQTKERLNLIDNYLSSSQAAVKNLAKYKKSLLLRDYWPYLEKIAEFRKIISQGREVLSVAPELLGQNGQRVYLLLLQNNFELRPTGGFIGSYAVLTFNKGAFEKIKIEDVYSADGQLKGAVSPPKMLAKYLNQPHWFLRDSNWDPDFAFSARQAEWFLEKETGQRFDGVFAVDLYFLKNLLEATEGVYVPDYGVKVTAADFFLKLQSETQENFFPGSTKKRDLLSSLSSALLIKLKEEKNLPYMSIFKALGKSLQEKHLLIYLHNRQEREVVERLGWGGRILSAGCQKLAAGCVDDYLMLVEANLGVNKANYYVRRDLSLSLSFEGNKILHKLIVYYQNNSPQEKDLFSGVYKNYLRIILPKKAELEGVNIGSRRLDLQKEVDIENYQGKKSVGFLLEVAPQKASRAAVEYNLPFSKTNKLSYQLLVQKQPGTDKDSFILKTEDLKNWQVGENNFSSLPFLLHLSGDRLLTIDFEK